jgi:hypothetical protein
VTIIRPGGHPTFLRADQGGETTRRGVTLLLAVQLRGRSKYRPRGAQDDASTSLNGKRDLQWEKCRRPQPDLARAQTPLPNSITLRNSRNKTARQFFSDFGEVPMTSQAIESACAFAWRSYLLFHSSISENDSRRSALYRYVTNLRDTGDTKSPS